jgi:hypothetical protein
MSRRSLNLLALALVVRDVRKRNQCQHLNCTDYTRGYHSLNGAMREIPREKSERESCDRKPKMSGCAAIPNWHNCDQNPETSPNGVDDERCQKSLFHHLPIYLVIFVNGGKGSEAEIISQKWCAAASRLRIQSIDATHSANFSAGE